MAQKQSLKDRKSRAQVFPVALLWRTLLQAEVKFKLYVDGNGLGAEEASLV